MVEEAQGMAMAMLEGVTALGGMLQGCMPCYPLCRGPGQIRGAPHVLHGIVTY